MSDTPAVPFDPVAVLKDAERTLVTLRGEVTSLTAQIEGATNEREDILMSARAILDALGIESAFHDLEGLDRAIGEVESRGLELAANAMKSVESIRAQMNPS